MKIQSVKGTRDFYPPEMRLRRWLEEKFREVSLRHGFEEYDGPIFEHLDLFTAKSGEEIVSQLYNFEDRGGRRLAIRPEMTPTLARMINQKHASLPKPIKWFSIPRLCRAERPQRGRLREFFQWNIDVVGDDSILADAECIAVMVDLLREVGLTAEDVVVLVGSRRFLDTKLSGMGLSREKIDALYAVIDKKRKIPEEAFQEMLVDLLAEEGAALVGPITELLAAGAADDSELQSLQSSLVELGVADYCAIDLSVVRGLAYYTGVVFEVYDRGQSMRAVAGGGRYDQLCEVLGGPKMPAAGFGMGDVVLANLLEEKGKLPELGRKLDAYVIAAGEKRLTVVAACRGVGLRADFYRGTSNNLGKQLKAASVAGARNVVIVEEDGVRVQVKNMSTGEQREHSLDEFMSAPKRQLR